MYDENPSKRCIHCALTDKAGVQGKIGTISTNLMSLLFPNEIVSEDRTERTAQPIAHTNL